MMKKTLRPCAIVLLLHCVGCNAASDATLIRNAFVAANTDRFPACAVHALASTNTAYVTELDQSAGIVELRKNSDATVPGLLGRFAKADRNRISIYVFKHKDSHATPADADKFILDLQHLAQSACQ